MPGQAMQEFDIGGTRRRSLDGVTILLVEDSLSASEAMRLMALSAGARLRRADNIETAEGHLTIYRPDVVIVDLGLPDGNGLELIGRIAEDPDLTSAIIAISGADEAEWTRTARDSGAKAIVTKPIAGIDVFQDAILSCLPDRQEREGYRRATRIPASDGAAIGQDIHTISEHLTQAIAAADIRGLRYGGRFIEGLAKTLEEPRLGQAARALYVSDIEDGKRIILARQVLQRLARLSPSAAPEGR